MIHAALCRKMFTGRFLRLPSVSVLLLLAEKACGVQKSCKKIYYLVSRWTLATQKCQLSALGAKLRFEEPGRQATHSFKAPGDIKRLPKSRTPGCSRLSPSLEIQPLCAAGGRQTNALRVSCSAQRETLATEYTCGNTENTVPPDIIIPASVHAHFDSGRCSQKNSFLGVYSLKDRGLTSHYYWRRLLLETIITMSLMVERCKRVKSLNNDVTAESRDN